MTFVRSSLCCIFAAAAFAGCRSAELAQGPSGEPQYQSLQLSYEVNGQYRDLPLDQAVRQADFQSDADHHCWRSAKLDIAYPHPERMPGLARATLRLSTQRGSVYSPVENFAFQSAADDFPGNVSSDLRGLHSLRDDEIWVLDVPRQQIDLLLSELQQSGFFQSQRRIELGTRLDVQINGGRTAKNWSPEPRLDEFVSRVHAEGRLSGFVTCGRELHEAGRAIARSP